MARPRKEIDPSKVRYMAEIGCSEPEIAKLLGCTDRLLRLRFHDVLELGWAQRNYNLRKLQYEIAKKHSTGMAIWLGKQWLGQKERPELSDQRDSLKKLLDAFSRRYDEIKDDDEESAA